MEERYKILASLHRQDCTDCKLCEHRQNIINSYLPEQAEILIISDAPGETEDTTGTTPYIGRAGKAIKNILIQTKFELNSPQIAYAYMVRCFPRETNPKKLAEKKRSRPVKDSEAKVCMKFLKEEIKSLKNLKVIIGMGAVTARLLLQDSKLKLESVFGKVLYTDYGKVIITHSPRRLLYSPDPRELLKIKTEVMRTFKMGRDVINEEAGEIDKKDYNHYWALNMVQVEWVFNQLEKSKIFSYDLETSSLDYMSSEILSVSFSWKDRVAATIPFYEQHLVPIWNSTEEKLIYSKLKQIMENPLKKKVAQNGKFDNQHLFTKGIDVKGFEADTMLMSYCVNENNDHDLKSLAWVHTDLGGYDNKLDSLRGEWAKKLGVSKKEVSYADLPHKDLWEYANTDADVTLRIYNSLLPEIARQDLGQFLYEYQMPMSRFLTRMEYYGVRIDQERLGETIEDFKFQINELGKLIFANEDVKKYIELKRNKHKQVRGVKWRKSKHLQTRYEFKEYVNIKLDKITFNSKSPKQLRELFIDQLKMKVVKKTDKGNPAFDREALQIYSHKIPIAKILSEKNKLMTLLSTFLEGMRRNIRVDGKLHSSFNQQVAATGRLSSSNVNLQNVPNKTNNPIAAKFIRDIFIADEGCEFIDADYKQNEFRVWGQLSGDPVLLRDLESGVDIHTKIASLGFGVPESEVTPVMRGIAKTIVFGNMYGRSPKSVAKQLGVSIKQAEKIQAALFNRYKVAAKWIENTRKRAIKDKQIRGLFGQIRHLEGLVDSPIEEVRSKALRQGVNCVDYKTEILTRNGWKKYNEVKSGDLGLTKNKDTGKLEWQEIEYVNLYPNYEGEIYSIRSKSFSTVCSPNHRWLIYNASNKRNEVRETQKLSKWGESRIHRVGKYDGNNLSEWYDTEVGIIGWVLTDGWYCKHKRWNLRTICIGQSKEKNKLIIHRLLTDVGIKFREKDIKSTNIYNSNTYTIWGFTDYLAKKIRKYLPDKILTPEFLLSLTKSQLTILYRNMMLGDGIYWEDKKPNRGGTRNICMPTELEADMFQMLLTLIGKSGYKVFRPTRNKEFKSLKLNNIIKPKKGIWLVLEHKRERIQIAKHQVEVKYRKEPLWCPTLKNGTFVARREGQSYITGNSPIQGSASQLNCFAAMKIQDKFDSEGIEGRVVLLVHDSILCNVKVEQIERGKEIVRECMLSPHPDVTIPLGVDIDTGFRWGDAIELPEGMQLKDGVESLTVVDEEEEGENVELELSDTEKYDVWKQVEPNSDGEDFAWYEITGSRKGDKYVHLIKHNISREEAEDLCETLNNNEDEILYNVLWHPESTCVWKILMGEDVVEGLEVERVAVGVNEEEADIEIKKISENWGK